MCLQCGCARDYYIKHNQAIKFSTPLTLWVTKEFRVYIGGCLDSKMTGEGRVIVSDM